MAVIKCKMCGGDLVIEPGSTVAECEYCGSRQTVPTADNEKKLTLFARANRLRAACEFDKAAGIYESIVADFTDVAAIFKSENYGVVALLSDGRIRGHGLVAEKKWSCETCKDEDMPTKFAKLLEEYGGRSLFGNVDTLEEDRIRIRKQRDEERTRQCWREAGVCQRCGGIFKGLLFKKCINCGMSKDY